MADSDSTLQMILTLQDDASSKLAQAKSALQDFQSQMSTTGNSATQAGSQVSDMGDKTEGAGNSFSSMALAMAGGLGIFTSVTAVVGDLKQALIEAINDYTNFSATMSSFQMQLGLSKQQTDDLTTAIGNMGGAAAEFSSQDLANSLLEIYKDGFSGAQALQLLQGAAESAAVSQSDLKTTTDVLVAVLNSHITGVTDLQSAQGQLNTIMGLGNVSMEDFAGVLSSRMSPLLKAMGMSLADVGAVMDVYSRQGVDAQSAVMGLEMAMAALDKPTTDATKALGDIHLTQSQLATDMQQGGIIQAMTDLKTHLVDSGADANQTGTILEDVFSRRGVSAIQPLLDNLPEVKTDIDKIQGSTTGVDSEFNIWQDTTKAKLNVALSETKDFLTDIGNLISGPLNAALDTYDTLLGLITSKTKELSTEQVNAQESADKMGHSANTTATSLIDVGQSSATATQNIGSLGDGVFSLLNKTTPLNTATDKTATSLSGVSTAAQKSKLDLGNLNSAATSAASAAATLAKSVTDLKQNFIDLHTSTVTEITNLTDEADQKLSSLQDKIDSTSKSITDLTASYNQTTTANTGDIVQDIANVYVDIANKQKELAADQTNGASSSSIQTLQDAIAADQAELAANQGYIKSYQQQINDAVAEGEKDQLTQEIDTIQKKQLAEQAAYQTKLNTLNKELSDAKAEQLSEALAYSEKIQAIANLDAQAQVAYNNFLNDHFTATKTTVNQEIELYNQLAKAISNAKAGATTPTLNPNLVLPNLGSVHDAIITPQGVVHTDPEDYIIATKTPGNLGMTGGGNFAITINNPTVRNNSDLQALEKMFRNIMMNYKIKVPSV